MNGFKYRSLKTILHFDYKQQYGAKILPKNFLRL